MRILILSQQPSLTLIDFLLKGDRMGREELSPDGRRPQHSRDQPETGDVLAGQHRRPVRQVRGQETVRLPVCRRGRLRLVRPGVHPPGRLQPQGRHGRVQCQL